MTNILFALSVVLSTNTSTIESGCSTCELLGLQINSHRGDWLWQLPPNHGRPTSRTNTTLVTATTNATANIGEKPFTVAIGSAVLLKAVCIEKLDMRWLTTTNWVEFPYREPLRETLLTNAALQIPANSFTFGDLTFRLNTALTNSGAFIYEPDRATNSKVVRLGIITNADPLKTITNRPAAKRGTKP